MAIRKLSRKKTGHSYQIVRAFEHSRPTYLGAYPTREEAEHNQELAVFILSDHDSFRDVHRQLKLAIRRNWNGNGCQQASSATTASGKH